MWVGVVDFIPDVGVEGWKVSRLFGVLGVLLLSRRFVGEKETEAGRLRKAGLSASCCTGLAPENGGTAALATSTVTNGSSMALSTLCGLGLCSGAEGSVPVTNGSSPLPSKSCVLSSARLRDRSGGVHERATLFSSTNMETGRFVLGDFGLRCPVTVMVAERCRPDFLLTGETSMLRRDPRRAQVLLLVVVFTVVVVVVDIVIEAC